MKDFIDWIFKQKQKKKAEQMKEGIIKISKNKCPVCDKFMKDDTEAQQEYCEKCGVWYNY